MKYIKFSEEVIRVPESVTFWVQFIGPEYSASYCVNMSELQKQNFMGEPNLNSIIRSEGYRTAQEAHDRLNELLGLLNSGD